eukprot:10424917-Ditylum_brightwellii.AAC.1
MAVNYNMTNVCNGYTVDDNFTEENSIHNFVQKLYNVIMEKKRINPNSTIDKEKVKSADHEKSATPVTTLVPFPTATMSPAPTTIPTAILTYTTIPAGVDNTNVDYKVHG